MPTVLLAEERWGGRGEKGGYGGEKKYESKKKGGGEGHWE